MKKAIFKTLAAVFAVIFLLSSLSMISFADEATELENIAPKGMAYCSSMKNSNWTPPSSIIDQLPNDWHGWEPKYPTIEPTQNTTLGFNGEYCGIKFLNNEYYEVHQINMNVGLHALYRQNTVYKIEALIEGEWKDVVTLKDEQFKPTSYDSYEDAMENDKSNYHIRAELSYTLDKPITTNNIRITINEFAKNYPGGDVLIFPYIYEVELIGKRGVTPDITLPEGAIFSQNAAYNSLPYATSSKSLAYPYLAIDGKDTTAWKPESLTAGQSLTLELEKAYKIDKVKLNFGKLNIGQKAVNYKFKIEALVDGAWQKLADGNSYNEAEASYITEYALATPVITEQVRIVFEEALESTPAVYEFEVNIVGERTYYLESRFTASQKHSSAKGNLAILGTAYASANLAPYSDPSFINDGRAFKDSDVWFGGTLDIPVSCGIKLDKTYTINKIVLYCAEPTQLGQDVTYFNIIANINGESKVISEGRSYYENKTVENSEVKYTTIYEFPDGITTDDIKIEFTRGNSTIPNIMELEVYSNTAVSSAFQGFDTYLKQPEYTNQDTEAPNDDTPDLMPIIITAVCVLVLGLALGAFFVVKSKKCEAGTQEQGTENNTENSVENE